MKPTVYIETTVIGYLVAQPSRDLIVAAHQQITHAWWETVLPFFDGFVSPIALEEISRGDARAAKSRLERVSAFPLLDVLPEVRDLADLYFSAMDIPEKARADSYHVAVAAWHSMDYLVSWNCSHIVSGRVRRIIEEINAGAGIPSPVICTPEELMEA
ncbi:MAG: type II toxin-antitoxin system VapC family toxin [Thermodesulfobacteriota bacterium]